MRVPLSSHLRGWHCPIGSNDLADKTLVLQIIIKIHLKIGKNFEDCRFLGTFDVEIQRHFTIGVKSVKSYTTLLNVPSGADA